MGDAEQCVILTRQYSTQALEQGATRLEMEALLMEALALHELDDRGGAVDALQRALIKATPQNFARRFVEEGARMERMLQDIIRHLGVANMDNETVNFISRVMANLKNGVETIKEGCQAHILSVREMEVLRELDLGLATKVIARKLDLSEATVKFHLGNIYKKFGVNTRKLAISIAHQKGILNTSCD